MPNMQGPNPQKGHTKNYSKTAQLRIVFSDLKTGEILGEFSFFSYFQV